MSTVLGNQNPFLLTLPQVLSGRKKLALAATEYDPAKSPMTAFQTRAMNPTQFREQLRRLFNLQVTDSELGGLVALFDKDGVGMVDCTSFTNEFFRLGRVEKSRQVQQKMRAQRQYEERRAKQVAEVQQKYEQSVTAEVAEFTEADVRSAEKKLARVAKYYDPSRHGLLSTMTQCPELTPTEFKARLWNSFNIKLTARELGALVHAFDKSNSGNINLTEFLVQFYRLGRGARKNEEKRLRQIRHKQEESNKLRLEKQNSQQEIQIKPTLLDAREQDRISAIEKLNHAARLQVDQAVIQQAFQTKNLDPWEFKEQLKLVFGICLTLRELSAVTELFDRNGDGTIDSAEFLFTFSYIGNRERAKMRKDARAANIQRKLKREKFRKRMEDKFVAMTATSVVWPHLPSVLSLDGGSSLEFFDHGSIATRKSSVSSGYGVHNQPSTASLEHVTEDTRKFLEEIEKEEAALSRIGSTRRTMRRKRKSSKVKANRMPEELATADGFEDRDDAQERLKQQQSMVSDEDIDAAQERYEDDAFDDVEV